MFKIFKQSYIIFGVSNSDIEHNRQIFVDPTTRDLYIWPSDSTSKHFLFFFVVFRFFL